MPQDLYPEFIACAKLTRRSMVCKRLTATASVGREAGGNVECCCSCYRCSCCFCCCNSCSLVVAGQHFDTETHLGTRERHSCSRRLSQTKHKTRFYFIYCTLIETNEYFRCCCCFHKPLINSRHNTGVCGTTFATATATATATAAATATTACVRSQETDDASGASADDTRATKLSLSLRFRHEHSHTRARRYRRTHTRTHTHCCTSTNTKYVNAAATAAWSFKALSVTTALRVSEAHGTTAQSRMKPRCQLRIV